MGNDIDDIRGGRRVSGQQARVRDAGLQLRSTNTWETQPEAFVKYDKTQHPDADAATRSLPALSTSTTMATPSGLRSPASPRSNTSSPRPKFDSDSLKAYIKKLLPSILQTATWPEAKERDKVKEWIKEIGERVKERMVSLQGQGFKYIVLTQINENLGQGGRADMVCHWEDSDTVAQEMYANESLICICIAFAIRTI